MYVEVLSLVVGFVLNMPNPAMLAVAPFVLPQVEVVEVGLDLLRVGPRLRDIFVVAPADSAALALAYFVHGAELAVLVDIEADDSEVLCLHELAQGGRSPLVYLLERVRPEPRAGLQVY